MSERILIGTRKGLFDVRRRGPGRYEVAASHFVGVPVSMTVRDSRDGGIVAALVHGHFGVKLHRSDDDGKTWREIAAPTYPEQPADAPPQKDPMGRTIEWKLSDVWALEPGAADQPKRLWCGTIPGGLFRSEDGGDSWQLVESLWNDERRTQWFGGGADAPGIHSVCVDPRDAKRVVIGVSCGGVWVSEDDGRTWEPRCEGMRAAYMPPERAYDPVIQDPHRVVQCRARPDVLWTQHHNGIFRSTDDLASWQEIERAGPSTFGFAVAVHPDDADTAWFVPAVKDENRVPVDGAFVVTRTRDGGKSFDVLTDGLPAPPAYDLVYRHALEVDESGERLAMGSTTGSLWVSEDGGDAWAHVTAHLPPVRCVRWA